eukprot:gene38272-46184_t
MNLKFTPPTLTCHPSAASAMSTPRVRNFIVASFPTTLSSTFIANNHTTSYPLLLTAFKTLPLSLHQLSGEQAVSYFNNFAVEPAVLALGMVTLQLPYMRELTAMSYLSAFGGGTVAPVLIGRPSFVLNNDFPIFACICVWYV